MAENVVMLTTSLFGGGIFLLYKVGYLLRKRTFFVVDLLSLCDVYMLLVMIYDWMINVGFGDMLMME